jgi:hypothetical protein
MAKAASEVSDLVLKDLRRFEADFKRFVSQLQKISEGGSLSGEDAQKFNNVKKRLSAIQNEISNTVESVSTPYTATSSTISMHASPMIIRCKHWEDFKLHALKADAISFLYKEEERIFQVDAVKGGKVYTYSGQLPNNAELLKTWLSQEIGVEESNVLEGVLALG